MKRTNNQRVRYLTALAFPGDFSKDGKASSTQH